MLMAGLDGIQNRIDPGDAMDKNLYDLPPEASAEATEAALRDCWCLVKDGVVVREDGSFTDKMPPVEIRSREVDVDLSGLTRTDLLQNATLRFEHLDARLLADGRVEGP